jgi:hypothetical protein
VDLITEFSGDRNISTIGNKVFNCPNKRVRREGYECSIQRVAEIAD